MRSEKDFALAKKYQYFPPDASGLSIMNWAFIIGLKYFNLAWKYPNIKFIKGYEGWISKKPRKAMQVITLHTDIVELIHCLWPFTIDKRGVESLAAYVVSNFTKQWPTSFAEQVIKHLFINPGEIQKIGLVARMYQAEREICFNNTYEEEKAFAAYFIRVENIKSLTNIKKDLQVVARLPIFSALEVAFSLQDTPEFEELFSSYKAKILS